MIKVQVMDKLESDGERAGAPLAAAHVAEHGGSWVCTAIALPFGAAGLSGSPACCSTRRAGLDVRGAVRRIWQGERNEATLLQVRGAHAWWSHGMHRGHPCLNLPDTRARRWLQGKDGGTQLAIKAILFHTINLEKKHGKKSG